MSEDVEVVDVSLRRGQVSDDELKRGVTLAHHVLSRDTVRCAARRAAVLRLRVRVDASYTLRASGDASGDKTVSSDGRSQRFFEYDDPGVSSAVLALLRGLVTGAAFAPGGVMRDRVTEALASAEEDFGVLRPRFTGAHFHFATLTLV